MPKDYSLDMDAITAHLDRGWGLLHHGDLAGARVSAGHILGLNADSPEGHTLTGAILAAEGDTEEAVDSLRHAVDLDPEYLDGLLYLAELTLHTLGDLDQGLSLCEEAAVLAREPEDRLDVALMRAEAHLLAGDRKLARRALQGVPESPRAEPPHQLRAGRVYLEVGEVERAVELFESSLQEESCRSDAHYFLGVALEQQDLPGQALEHFLEASRLDRQLPAPSWALSSEQLEQQVGEIVQRLSPVLRDTLTSLPRYVMEFPPVELVAEGFDPRGLLFISGASLEHGGQAVFIYKGNLERASTSPADLKRTLEQVLSQELELFIDAGMGAG